MYPEIDENETVHVGEPLDVAVMLEKSAQPPSVVVTVRAEPDEGVAVTVSPESGDPEAFSIVTRIDPRSGLTTEEGTATRLVSSTICWV